MEIQRKRLIMRAEHRGIKEMDIIMGGFVRENVATFSAEDMQVLEAMMEINDQALYQMILGNEDIPEGYEDWIVRIRAYLSDN